MDLDKVTVRVLWRKKNAVLVEHIKDEDPIRVSVPATRISPITQENQAEISNKDLAMGIPYGIPWASKLKGFPIEITGEAIEKEFHKVGIWTYDDFRKNPQALTGVIMAVNQNVANQILLTIKEYSTKEV